MEVQWKINGASLADLKLTLASARITTQAVSYLTLNAAKDFDADEILPYGTAVTLTRQEAEPSPMPVFSGKIRRIGKNASAAYEGHDYVIEDAWADLAATIYQELWAIGAGAHLFPRCVLGIGYDALAETWGYITVGQQIRNVLTYAISVGADLQIGAIPDGEQLLPDEVMNVTCEEVIKICLKYHPDWLPWIDHSTTPPTFNVTVSTALEELNLSVGGLEKATDFDIEKLDEILPDSVRIVYELATTIDDGEGNTSVYRDGIIDKWPAAGPDGGPKVLCAVIPLSGMDVQRQAVEIQTRDIPATQAEANEFIRRTYPHLADLNDTDFTVTRWEKSLVVDDETKPNVVNPRAPRMVASTVEDLPRMLVAGSLSDWMRVMVGKVKIKIAIKPSGTASTEARKAIAKGTSPVTIRATNAETRVYSGIAQWVAPEDVPTGIAQAAYEAIHAAPKYAGSITLAEGEIPLERRYGKKINLLDGLPAWETMNVPVHSVSWDVESGKTTVEFGPPPHLAPVDLLEFQRMLRARPKKWWTFDERGSNRLGADLNQGGSNKPSAAGDTVAGFYSPVIDIEAGDKGSDGPFSLRSMEITEAGTDNKITIWPGWIREIKTIAGGGILLHMPEVAEVLLNDETPPEFTMDFEDSLYCSYSTDESGNVTLDPDKPTVSVITGTGSADTTHYQPHDDTGSGGIKGAYKIKLGTLHGTNADDAWWEPAQNSDIEHYQELWRGRNLGAGGGIWKQRAGSENLYDFRGIRADYGLNWEKESEDIRIDLLAESIGGGSSVYKTPEDPENPGDGPAQFRTLRGLSVSEAGAGHYPQIQVAIAESDEDPPVADSTIRIRGNGKSGRLRKATTDGTGTSYEVLLNFDDGLVTDEGDIDFTVESGDGITADVVIFDCPVGEITTPTDLSSYPCAMLLRLAVENGKIVGVNEDFTTRAQAAVYHVQFMQSCHWVDDVAHDHAI